MIFWTDFYRRRATHCKRKSRIPHLILLTAADSWLCVRWAESPGRNWQRVRAFARSRGAELQGCPDRPRRTTGYGLTGEIFGNWLPLSSAVDTCPFLWLFLRLTDLEGGAETLTEKQRGHTLSLPKTASLRYWIHMGLWVSLQDAGECSYFSLSGLNSEETEQCCYMRNTERSVLLAFIHMVLKIQRIWVGYYPPEQHRT